MQAARLNYLHSFALGLEFPPDIIHLLLVHLIRPVKLAMHLFDNDLYPLDLTNDLAALRVEIHIAE